MANDALSELEVGNEVERLLKLLSYWETPDGIAYHTADKGTSHVYGITMTMLMTLIDDAEQRGMNPAYLLYFLCSRVWAQSDDKLRAQIEQFWTFDKREGIYLDEEMRKKVEANRKKSK